MNYTQKSLVGLHLSPRKSAQCFVRGNGEKLAILGHESCELFRISALWNSTEVPVSSLTVKQ